MSDDICACTKRRLQLSDIVNLACSPENVIDDYHLGMANGLILAYAIVSNTTPSYLDRDRIHKPSVTNGGKQADTSSIGNFQAHVPGPEA